MQVGWLDGLRVHAIYLVGLREEANIRLLFLDQFWLVTSQFIINCASILQRGNFITIRQVHFIPLVHEILLKNWLGLGLADLHQSRLFSFFSLVLFSDGLVDDGSSLLQQFDSADQVVVLEVAASVWIDILAISRLIKVCVRVGILNTGVYYLIEHMNSYEICHFGVHDFAVEQLECKILLIAGSIAVLSLNLHVVKINFGLADPRSLSRVVIDSLNHTIVGRRIGWQILSLNDFLLFFPPDVVRCVRVFREVFCALRQIV